MDGQTTAITAILTSLILLASPAPQSADKTKTKVIQSLEEIGQRTNQVSRLLEKSKRYVRPTTSNVANEEKR